MKIDIREIQPVDYNSVLALWVNEIGNKWVTLENITATYQQMGNDDIYKTFVALADNAVVGFITTVQVLAVGFPVGYIKINGLAVQKQFQGKGIGTQLVRHVEELASKSGTSNIGLASGLQRTQAHEFYEHLGYNKGSYYFSKMI